MFIEYFVYWEVNNILYTNYNNIHGSGYTKINNLKLNTYIHIGYFTSVILYICIPVCIYKYMFIYVYLIYNKILNIKYVILFNYVIENIK